MQWTWLQDRLKVVRISLLSSKHNINVVQSNFWHIFFCCRRERVKPLQYYAYSSDFIDQRCCIRKNIYHSEKPGNLRSGKTAGLVRGKVTEIRFHLFMSFTVIWQKISKEYIVGLKSDATSVLITIYMKLVYIRHEFTIHLHITVIFGSTKHGLPKHPVQSGYVVKHLLPVYVESGGYWRQQAAEKLCNPPQGNQEPLVVKDKVERTSDQLGMSNSVQRTWYPSVLWQCWLATGMAFGL